MRRSRRYPLKGIQNSRRSGQYGKDFLTGCSSLAIIGIIVFIVIPLLLFVLKISVFFAVMIGIAIVLFFAVAFWGRFVNFIRDSWR